MVAIGEMGMLLVDEFLARNREKRVEDRLFRDSAPLELALDHLLAVGFEVCHCDGHWSTSGLSENPPAREAVPPDDLNRYGFRRFDPRPLRPLHGASAVPALCRRSRAARSQLRPARYSRNRRRNGTGHSRAAFGTPERGYRRD